MTTTLKLVVAALADGHNYGRVIAEATDLESGTVHPILARLERAGWAISEWEDVDPAAEKRPRRRLYQLTDEGRRVASRLKTRRTK